MTDNRNVLSEGFVIRLSKFLNFESYLYNYLIYELKIELSSDKLIEFERCYFKLIRNIEFNENVREHEKKLFYIFFLFATLSNKNNEILYSLIENKEDNSKIAHLLTQRIEFEYSTENAHIDCEYKDEFIRICIYSLYNVNKNSYKPYSTVFLM